MNTKAVFTGIFKQNAWNGIHSVSGTGSELDQTEKIINQLPILFERLAISTILDIPCGDFHWMRAIDFGKIKYVGADLVEELILQNEKYEASNISFENLNLLNDKLPKVDLILCRDCLVHFSFKDALSALKNICDSKSTYLLTTSFPSRLKNGDIQTGEWRPLNLQKPPFDFPEPLHTLVEGCTEENGAFWDKSLTLWRIADIKNQL